MREIDERWQKTKEGRLDETCEVGFSTASLYGNGGIIVKRRLLGSILLTIVASALVSVVQADENCHSPEGLLATISNPDVKFLIFGEVHGTAESPKFFADSVCTAVVSGKKVLVGLEWLEETSDVFQQFMSSSGSSEDVGTLLKETGWERQALQFPDGRTSLAMLAMVQRLRELNQGGYELTVLPFAPGSAEPGDPYEGGMAANLMDAESSGSYDLVMVLVGNVHAYGAMLDMGTPYQPMAMYLPKDKTLTLRMLSSGGEAWNCRGNVCGAHALRSSTIDETVGIRIEEGSAPGYDGTFNIGTASASPPATGLP